MIHALVAAAVARVREELAELLPEPERRVVAGPAPEPGAGDLPLIVLSPGRLQVSQAVKEGKAGPARPQPAVQRLEITDPTRLGPYPLDHLPLEGTALGRLVLTEGTVAERGTLLVEGEDFTIDYQAGTLSLTTDLAARIADHLAGARAQIQARAGREFNVDSPQELSSVLFEDLKLPPQGERNGNGYYSTAKPVLEALADRHPIVKLVQVYRVLKAAPSAVVRLEYSFPGIFTVREFQQELRAEVYDASGEAVAPWASLVAGTLLTWHDELLREGRAEYPSRRSVSTSHQPTRMEWVEGVPGAFAAGASMRLTFQVTGQVRLVREAAGTYGIIRRVGSPGSAQPGEVAVEVGLG